MMIYELDEVERRVLLGGIVSEEVNISNSSTEADGDRME